MIDHTKHIEAVVMIKKCSFGAMVIDDKTYTSDLIIYPDGSVSDNWWRSSGHRLTLEDIRDLLIAEPEVIVAGTGIYGRMQLNADVQSVLITRGIELIAGRTESAAEQFNRLKQTSRQVGGCFHLTC
jgi:hypothetical protein